MPTPYDTGLDRNAANYQPLTPLSFLARAAAVYPDATAIIHGAALLDLPGVLCAREKARIGAGAARHQARRHGLGHARQHAGHARGALRRADDRRRAQHAQHAARRRDHRLHARPCRGQGADHRPRILQGDEGRARARQGEAARHRLRRPGILRRRRTPRRSGIRGLPARRRSPISPGGCRTTNGTRSRSTTPRARPAIRRASSTTTAAPICSRWATSSPAACSEHSGLSVDAADVPLQRLVLSVDAVDRRRHACLPARGARSADLRRDRRAQGHASVRRADRDVDAAQRRAAGEEAVAARRRVRHRGRAAARGGARGDEGRRLQRHPCLRPDRDLRAGDRQRLARRLGRAPGRRAGGEEGAPGRALSGARGARRARSGNDAAGRRATARRSAK